MAQVYSFVDENGTTRLFAEIHPDPAGTPFNGGTITNPLVITPANNNVVPEKINVSLAGQNVDMFAIHSTDGGGADIVTVDSGGALNMNQGGAVTGGFSQDGADSFNIRNTQSLGHATFTATGCRVGGSATDKVGLFGVTPVVQPTVAGAKLPGDVVMASLLTALAALGLVIDTTT